MKTHASSTWIGFFVIVGLLMFFLALISLGAKSFFEKKVDFILFFDGSVNGLSIGSPVKFRGVQIGEVKNILVTVDTNLHHISVPVYIEIDPRRLTFEGKKPLGDGSFMQKLAKKGLRAELKQESFITGMLYIDMEFKPNTPLVLRENDTDLRQIPTLPSEAQMLKDALSEAQSAIEGIDQLVRSKELKNAITGFNNVMFEMQVSLKKVNKSTDAFNTTLYSIDTSVDPVSDKLWSTLDEFSDTMASINALTEYLTRHPEALLQGKGQPKDKNS